jgi:hypothetical protein
MKQKSNDPHVSPCFASKSPEQATSQIVCDGTIFKDEAKDADKDVYYGKCSQDARSGRQVSIWVR